MDPELLQQHPTLTAAAAVALGAVAQRVIVPWLEGALEDRRERMRRADRLCSDQLSRCESERDELTAALAELMPTLYLLRERLRVAERDRGRCAECGRRLDDSSDMRT